MIKIDSNHIFVSSYAHRHELKAMGGTWSSKHQAFKFPKSAYVMQEIEDTCPALSQSKLFEELTEKLHHGREKLRDMKQARPKQKQGDRLREYQRQDVQYLTAIPHAGVFNQPRTGKTPTMIETVKERGAIKTLVIVPASLQYNWKREIEIWHTDAQIYMYNGTPKNRAQQLSDFTDTLTPAYLIVSKDTAKRDKEALAIDHDICIVDEAHYLRNDDTLQSKAVYTIGYMAKHRYALTGTPTVKHPSDVFGILKFLYPHKWTSRWAFIGRYFNILDNGFGKTIGAPIAHRVKELQDFMDAISTQRLRKDVMQWLPNKTKHQHICKMDSKQAKAYKSMLEDFFVEQGDKIVDTENVLSQLMRLRQITLDPSLIGLNIPSAKTDALLEALEENVYATDSEPVIIMSMFTSYLKQIKPMIEKLGKRVRMITGEMSNNEKNESAKAFQRGDVDVLLCNIISAGTGFTLDKGEVIIFTDKAWNPSDNEQAEDRVTPTAQERNHKHFIVSMVCENTIDQKIEALLENKENLTSVINQCKSVAELKRYLLS